MMKKTVVIICSILLVGFCLLCSPLFDTPYWRGQSAQPEFVWLCGQIIFVCSAADDPDGPGLLPPADYFDLLDDVIICATEQPLSKYQVYVLVTKAKMRDDPQFFYSNKRVPEPPDGYRYVFACNVAYKVDGDKYIGSNSRDYRDYWGVAFVSDDHVEGRLSTSLVRGTSGGPPAAQITAMETFELDATDIRSQLPPFPGCLLGPDKQLYYPEGILPAMKAYYPQLRVPEEYIIRDK